uniref:Uncharacterized protein n=1 Tax=Chromera velia CCMP2878 TaxID=1169474 RepID=A0A0G4GBZ8_9ALVE|eukprot:Cvel_21223.t1-p1 / transcript=Cvel_21223.t1 / gene=Cvel_21223 / organism=Chromera_velia_CCMP2878 / gene_product=hypothetical protein / transcript_product=hypothetical protein / location=Cvel_scaffold1972:5524-5823(+) / protein_length=100 / sequence_SO=supercontig / SO=protein_coding / is_pseudo=false
MALNRTLRLRFENKQLQNLYEVLEDAHSQLPQLILQMTGFNPTIENGILRMIQFNVQPTEVPGVDGDAEEGSDSQDSSNTSEDDDSDYSDKESGDDDDSD